MYFQILKVKKPIEINVIDVSKSKSPTKTTNETEIPVKVIEEPQSNIIPKTEEEPITAAEGGYEIFDIMS